MKISESRLKEIIKEEFDNSEYGSIVDDLLKKGNDYWADKRGEQDEEDIPLVLGQPEGSYPQTAQEFAQQLNTTAPAGTIGSLVEDPEHWGEYGVNTGAELANSLNNQMFSDVYKEETGMRPRGFTNIRVKKWLEQEGYKLY